MLCWDTGDRNFGVGSDGGKGNLVLMMAVKIRDIFLSQFCIDKLKCRRNISGTIFPSRKKPEMLKKVKPCQK